MCYTFRKTNNEEDLAMERLLLFASLFVVTVLGVGILLCAFHIL